MTTLVKMTLAAARDGLAAGEFSAIELTEAYLAAIERANPALNAYIAVTAHEARAMANASDERRARGEEPGPLEGIPLGIKDLFGTKGAHTQAGSHILDGFKPECESTVTGNLWRDGAVMLGKLNMDEFATGSSNETSFYGSVVNPWRAEGSNMNLVPGGSSGGSAAAVSAWLCAGATATDTGGSIRQPAAFTGTVGIKPTYGRCSRWGVVAFASSLDQAGPIARTVEDAAILMTSMSGFDPKDSTSAAGGVMRTFIQIFALLAIATPALAQYDEIDRSKLYVSAPEACAAIEANGLAGIGEGMALSFADGISTFEFQCQFFDVKSREGSPFLLVEAVCEEPGLRFPDLISISPYEADTIEVVSLHDSQALDPTDDNPNPGVTIYTRCDDLDGLPR